MQKSLSIQAHLGELPDPRGGNALRHPWMNIRVIAGCAVICGANEWTDVEEFGHTRTPTRTGWDSAWTCSMQHGIPSHDTFSRVFARLDPLAFERCLESWVQAVVHSLQGHVLALDGKTLRGSHDHFRGQ